MASSATRRVGEGPFCVCTFLLNPHFDLEPGYIIIKPMKHRFQRYIVHGETLSTFHTQSNTFLSKQYVIPTIETNGGANAEKCQKPCQKQPLPLEARGPHLIRQCLDPPHSPCQTTARSFTHFRTTTQQSPHWLQQDAPNSPQNCPFPFDDHHPI